MPTSVTMPALGESVTEGTVTRWLKQEGEQVEADEPLLEVSTDKVDTEIPSPAAGVLTKILVAEDETVEVGAELAVIGGGDGDGGDGRGGETASAEDAEQTPQTPDQQVEDAEPGARSRSSPHRSRRSPAPGRRPTAAPAVAGGEGTSVTMPALGESVTEGTVTRWLKAVGDEVTADEPLLEVSTDKVDTEIPAPVSGTLLSITVNEDETVDVGAELAVIGTGSAGGSAPAPRRQPPAAGGPEAGGAARRRPRSRRRPRTQPQAAPAAKPAAPATATAQPGGDYGASGAQPAASPTSAPAPQVAPQAPPSAPAGDGGGAYVTPLVRRLAADQRRRPRHASPAPASAAGSASRTCWRRPSRRLPPPRPLRPALRRPGRRRRQPCPTRRCAAARRSCRGSARSSPGAWSSRCRSARS